MWYEPCVVSGSMLSSKAKRAKCSTAKQRVIIMLYNKVCDVVSNISELLEIQLLTDTTILQVGTDRCSVFLYALQFICILYVVSCCVFVLPQVSSMGITPFFVENVSELQLCAIKLVTAVCFLRLAAKPCAFGLSCIESIFQLIKLHLTSH